jgi:S-adenosylmethionine hydrolase
MPLITLTSDIGLQDFLVSAVKGRLLALNPVATVIDVTHTLSPFNYPQAAYVCKNAILNFPANTFHVVLLDLFDQHAKMLLVKHNDQYIGCADNGLITMILEELPSEVISLPFDNENIKNTFDCATAFGKAFRAIQQGKSLNEIGDESVSIKIKNALRPLHGPNYMEGQIIFIDNFENVIVNITKEEFEDHRRGRSFKIVFRRDEVIDTISTSYADVAESEKLALFNSANYLEIAINKGNAAGLFGLQGFSESLTIQAQYLQNRLVYQTIKIYFE